jgi:Bacterial Ig domain/Fibronectin type III domain
MILICLWSLALTACGWRQTWAATVALAWDASVTPHAVVGYELQYGRSSGTYDTLVDTGPSTSVVLAGLLDDTTYFFAARAYNNVGVSEDSNEVSYTTTAPGGDTTPPVVTLTAPAHGATVPRHSTVTLQATASDDVGVVDVMFSVNGVWHCTDTTAPYTCAWQVPAGQRRPYQLQAKAADAATNIGLSSIITVQSK